MCVHTHTHTHTHTCCFHPGYTLVDRSADRRYWDMRHRDTKTTINRVNVCTASDELSKWVHSCKQAQWPGHTDNNWYTHALCDTQRKVQTRHSYPEKINYAITWQLKSLFPCYVILFIYFMAWTMSLFCTGPRKSAHELLLVTCHICWDCLEQGGNSCSPIFDTPKAHSGLD